MKTINIDFDKEEHIDIILKLSKRNKFYEKDLNYLVGAIIPNNVIKDMKTNNFFKSPVNIYMAMPIYQMEEERKGYFVMNGKKVIGFIIYYNSVDIKTSHINFLLIDKKYRCKGYGIFLLKEVEKTNSIIMVDRVDISVIPYYLKNDYKLINCYDELDDFYKPTEIKLFKDKFIVNFNDNEFKTIIKKV